MLTLHVIFFYQAVPSNDSVWASKLENQLGHSLCLWHSTLYFSQSILANYPGPCAPTWNAAEYCSAVSVTCGPNTRAETYCINSRWSTLSEADGVQRVGLWVEELIYPPSWRVARCNEFLWSSGAASARVQFVRVVGTMWYSGCECRSASYSWKGYKLSLQTLWRLLLPRLHDYLDGVVPDLWAIASFSRAIPQTKRYS